MRSSLLVALALTACQPDPTAEPVVPARGAEVIHLDQLTTDAELAGAVAHTCVGFEQAEHVVRAEVGQTGRGVVRVSNLCDADLIVRGVQILDAWASMEAAWVPDAIPAGGEAEILVDFTPVGEHLHLGELVLTTDDPALPALAVDLIGLWHTEALRGNVSTAVNAHAGPDLNGVAFQIAQLDGSASTPDAGFGGSYAWSRRPGRVPPGATAAIVSPNAELALINPDVQGVWEFRLDVSNGFTWDRDFMILDVAPAGGPTNLPPRAVIAGPSTVAATTGSSVALDGTGSSDPDGILGALTHTWVLIDRPAGSTATITDPTSPTASIVPDVPGRYDLRLRVSDGLADDRDALRIEATGPATMGTALHIEGAAFGLVGLNANEVAFTSEAWFRTTSPTGMIFEVYNGGPLGADRSTYLTGGNVCFYVYTPSFSFACTTGGGFDDGQWHHVASTLGPAGQFLFVDGVLHASNATTSSAFNYDNSIRLGLGFTNPGTLQQTVLSGDIDEVRLWSVQRTAADITATWFTTVDPATPGLQGNWKLDGATTDRALIDSTGNNAAGTVFNYDANFDPWVPGAL
jgi:hypothetical protein